MPGEKKIKVPYFLDTLAKILKITKKLKNVTEVMISDCGHMIMIEKPDQTLDALISGLK